MTTNFNFTRFTNLLKLDIAENWKNSLFGLLGIYAAFLIPMLGWLWNPSAYSFHQFCNNMLGVVFLVTSFFFIFYASRIMICMNSKEKRISYLLLPATMFEKFLSRFVIVTVFLSIQVFVALLALELSRYLLQPLFRLPAEFSQSMLAEMAEMMTFAGRASVNNECVYYNTTLMQLLGFIFLLWNHSLFVLGGSRWYKHPFLKTLGVIIAVNLIGGVIFARPVETGMMERFFQWMSENFEKTSATVNGLITAGILFFGSLTIFNWWLSYWLFTRSQVIRRKWLGV